MPDQEATRTSNVPAEDPSQTPLIDARLAELTARYGGRFDDAQRAQVRARIARSVALGVSLRKTPLTNADEPEIVFVPYTDGGPAA